MKTTRRSYKVIVKERNFNNDVRRSFKNLIITDLFDKIGIALSVKRKEVTDELVEELTKRVDNYFYTLIQKHFVPHFCTRKFIIK